jgi:hypothetical protein
MSVPSPCTRPAASSQYGARRSRVQSVRSAASRVPLPRGRVGARDLAQLRAHAALRAEPRYVVGVLQHLARRARISQQATGRWPRRAV